MEVTPIQSQRKNSTLKGLHKYVVAGLSAFTLEYASFLLLFKVLQLPLLLANTLSFSFGLVVSFTLNRKWSFKRDNFHKATHHQLTLYILLAAFNLILTNVAIKFLKDGGIDPLIGKVMVMCMIVVWNFFIFDHLIFKGTDTEG